MDLISLPVMMMATRWTLKLVVVSNLVSKHKLNLKMTLKGHDPMRRQGKGGSILEKAWKGSVDVGGGGGGRHLFLLQSLEPNATSQSEAMCLCSNAGKITRTQMEMSEKGSSRSLLAKLVTNLRWM